MSLLQFHEGGENLHSGEMSITLHTEICHVFQFFGIVIALLSSNSLKWVTLQCVFLNINGL